MNTAVIASVISVVGAGFIGELVVFLQAIRADISGLGTDMTEVKASLSRIEATQEAHGKQLALMADHGERIAAIEATLPAAS